MKALVYHGPKDLRCEEIPDVSPKPGEVKVKIRACGICGSDVHGYLGITGRRIAPMVMGHEFSGEIAELGEGTSGKYKVGDRVTVQPVDFCGKCVNCKTGDTNVCLDKRFFGVLDVNGAMAEFLCVPEHLLYRLPDNLSFNEGALIEALAVSYCGVKKAGDLTGKNVLIVGGGTIGQLALAVVLTMNPGKVILSDLSAFRREKALGQGADYAINPADGDTTEQIVKLLGEKVDVSLEAVGIGITVAQALDALKPNGTCVWIGNSAKMIEINMQTVVTNALKVFGTYIYTHEQFGETIDYLAKYQPNLASLVTSEIPIEEGPRLFNELVTDTEKHLKVIVKF